VADPENIEFPPGMPQDHQEFMRRQISNQMMEADAIHVQIKHFFDELSVDHLVTFSMILQRAQRDPLFASYMEGMADAVLEHKHNRCPGCGKNHDEDLEAALSYHTSEQKSDPLIQDEVTIAGTNLSPEELRDLAQKWNSPDSVDVPNPALVEDPNQRGFNLLGDRMPANCSTCQDTKQIKVCNHPSGSHGQMTGAEGCPEPLLVPCPECSCPEWYTSEILYPSACHLAVGGVMLPTPTTGLLICSVCGQPGQATS
jgi:hypothetical protein